MRYCQNPNLPESTSILIIGEEYSKILSDKLQNMGILTLKMPENPHVDKRLASHADLSVMHLGGNKIALAPYLKGSGFVSELESLGMEIYFPEINQSALYPKDAQLNMCICGNKLLYNPASADKTIAQYLANDRGFVPVNVKQGYTKCSVCVINQNAIITSDAGIHKRAVEHGIDSLKIVPAHIELDGFDYGFIGGASFKLDANTLAFTGHLDNHPDKSIIIDFLCLHNTVDISLC